MKFLLSLLSLMTVTTTVLSFHVPQNINHRTTTSTTRINLVDPTSLAEQTTNWLALTQSSDPVGEARAAFALCFFGAVGSASLGRAAIPIVWKKYRLTQSLRGQGPTLGGSERIALPAIAGYPSDLALADVQQVLENNMTAAQIVNDFPIPNRPPGYLTYEAYAKANPDKNPLAVRAVFESLAITSEIVTPDRAQLAIDTYKADLSSNYQQLVDTLTRSKALAFSACAILVTLLGLADFFALYHLYRGWFPDWPGATTNFPFMLLDPDVGLMSIPKYFIN